MITRVGPLTTRTEDYESIFRKEAPRLWRIVYGVTAGRRDLAEDAVAEAFLRAMERQATVRDPAAWMTRTAVRLALEELRRERREGRATRREPQRWERDPDELQDLLQALRSLSANQRAAVILHYEEDLPLKEVARLMGISPATARVHVFRGRNRLRQLLQTEGNPNG